MKNKLILLSLVAAMFMTGCKEEQGEQTPKNDNDVVENTNNENTENNNGENNGTNEGENNTNNGEGENNNNGEGENTNNGEGENSNTENNNGNNEGNNEENNGGKPDVKPPVIITNNFEEALKKDYSNMTVQFALNGIETGQEYGSEYYTGDNGFVAVLDGSAAEAMGTTAYAWMFYSYYEGKSYAYWKGSNYVTEGWISNGSKGVEVGIKLAYFYMPFFLENITKDDVDYVMGAYVVKDESIAKVMSGLQFTYMTNHISCLDIFVNDDGYISKIRGFDDPNDEDYGFEVRLSSFGKTRTDNLGVEIPAPIGPSNIKTYVEMIGHEEIPDIYITDLGVVINDTVDSNETYNIIMDPDDTVDVSFSYKPNNANKREVHWTSTNENTAVLLASEESGHQFIRAIHPGTTEIYVEHINEYKEPISSKRIKVLVREPQQVQHSEADVYRFAFTGYEGASGNNTIGAVNTIAGSEAPFTIRAWRMYTRTGENSEHFDDNDIILYSDPASQNYFNTRFEDEVIFDFGSQQVSKMSFLYGLYWDNNAAQFLGNLESAKISTSNDGDNWDAIDVTEEMKAEFAKSTGVYDNHEALGGITPKVMSKEFEPATMVKMVIKAKNIGGNGLAIGMKDFVFAANENCHNYDDVDAVPVTNIAISAPKNKLKLGNSMKFTSVITPDNASNKAIRWKSSDSEVLSIDSRTGLATGLKAGTAKVTAVSTSANGVTSNEFEITVYEQDEIYDPNNFLIYKEFAAAGVVSGTNVFDVSFKIKNATSATLVLSFTVPGMPTPFENKIDVSYEEFDEVNIIYYFSTEDDATVKVRVAEDGSYIELTYFKGETYTLGSADQGVILRKVA